MPIFRPDSSAASTYQTTAAADDGRLQTDLATANSTYAKALNSPLSLGEGQGEGANLVYTYAIAAAQYTFTAAQSSDYAGLQTALCGIASGTYALGFNENYAEQTAQS